MTIYNAQYVRENLMKMQAKDTLHFVKENRKKINLNRKIEKKKKDK